MYIFDYVSRVWRTTDGTGFWLISTGQKNKKIIIIYISWFSCICKFFAIPKKSQ